MRQAWSVHRTESAQSKAYLRRRKSSKLDQWGQYQQLVSVERSDKEGLVLENRVSRENSHSHTSQRRCLVISMRRNAFVW